MRHSALQPRGCWLRGADSPFGRRDHQQFGQWSGLQWSKRLCAPRPAAPRRDDAWHIGVRTGPQAESRRTCKADSHHLSHCPRQRRRPVARVSAGCRRLHCQAFLREGGAGTGKGRTGSYGTGGRYHPRCHSSRGRCQCDRDCHRRRCQDRSHRWPCDAVYAYRVQPAEDAMRPPRPCVLARGTHQPCMAERCHRHHAHGGRQHGPNPQETGAPCPAYCIPAWVRVLLS